MNLFPIDSQDYLEVSICATIQSTFIIYLVLCELSFSSVASLIMSTCKFLFTSMNLKLEYNLGKIRAYQHNCYYFKHLRKNKCKIFEHNAFNRLQDLFKLIAI